MEMMWIIMASLAGDLVLDWLEIEAFIAFTSKVLIIGAFK